MKNILYTNDNLFILHGMNSETVDLIYLDPPFNSKRIYSAPVGSKVAHTGFKDMGTWADVNEEYLNTLAEHFPALTDFIASAGVAHSKAMAAYLTYMAQRIVEMHRVLKDTGSIYLHCDPTASHYLKTLLDIIFGKNNFRNEIVWRRHYSHNDGKKYGCIHDIIMYYTKSKDFIYNRQHIEYDSEYISKNYQKDEDGRLFRSVSMNAQGSGEAKYFGNDLLSPPAGTHWRGNQNRINQALLEKKIYFTSNGVPRYKQFINEIKGLAVQDVGTDFYSLSSQAKERTGYPTQKPLALLTRIIKASSNEGDVVMDPFCGCATTCVAAQQLGRKGIGIDISEKAAELLVERLSDDAKLFSDFVNVKTIPQRTDVQIVEPTKTVKERLYKEQNGLCNGCGKEFDIGNLEIDHIIPKAKGGGNYYENYQLLCGSCNKIKGDRPMEFLRLKIETRKSMLKEKIVFGE